MYDKSIMNTVSIFIFSFNAIMPLILLILLGYWLKRIQFINKEFLKYANKLVFHLSLPVLLFKNITDIESLQEISWDAVGFSMGAIVLLVLLGILMTLFIPERKQKGVVLQCVFRSNFALIGVPLAELIAGAEGVRIAAILSAFTIPVYNILAVVVLSVYGGKISDLSAKKILLGIVKNPLIIGVVSGILVVLVRPYVHLENTIFAEFDFVQTTIAYIAKTATPLALLVLGGQFEFQKIAGYRKQIMMATVGRIVMGPVIGIGSAALLTSLGVFSFDAATFAALIALFGTPVAVSSAIMAEAMDNDGQLAGQLVVWTSLFSVFTLFLTIFLCKGFGFL